jgi:serine/threonine-protein kinase
VKIRSEHVARVLDVGGSDGVPYMVMEYLEGHDLADELAERGPLPVAEAVGFVLQACEAVAEAHAAGIVHRDLKPANLFLAHRADGSRLVKVLDFGISKSVSGASAADLSLTATSALIGSPLYMSPEQMHSAKNVDGRTDIWALGAILFQTLTNRPPYVATSIPELCNALLNEAPPPLSDFRDDIPPELAAALSKALAKDKALRWQTVGELASALSAFAPEAKIHAERALRMPAARDDGVRVPTTERTGAPMPTSISVELTAGTSQLGNEATEASAPGAESAKTLDSWGKTGGSNSNPPRARVRPIAAIATGAAVAISLVAYGISRTTATATPSASPASSAPLPPATSAGAVSTAATPSPAVEPAASDSDAGASEQPATLPKPRAHPAPTERHRPAGKPSTPPPSEFGGRR